MQKIAPRHDLARYDKAVGAWGKSWHCQLPHVRVGGESEERRLVLAQPAHELALDGLVEHHVAGVHVHAGDAGLAQEVHRLEQLPGIEPDERGTQWHRSKVAVLGVGRLACPPLHLVQCVAQRACGHIFALHHDVVLVRVADQFRIRAGEQERMPRAVDTPEDRSNHCPLGRETAWNLLMPRVQGGRRARDVHHDGCVGPGCSRPRGGRRRGVDLPRHDAELDDDGFVLLLGSRVEEGLGQALRARVAPPDERLRLEVKAHAWRAVDRSADDLLHFEQLLRAHPRGHAIVFHRELLALALGRDGCAVRLLEEGSGLERGPDALEKLAQWLVAISVSHVLMHRRRFLVRWWATLLGYQKGSAGVVRCYHGDASRREPYDLS